jgi:hypothetical protein
MFPLRIHLRPLFNILRLQNSDISASTILAKRNKLQVRPTLDALVVHISTYQRFAMFLVIRHVVRPPW